MGQTVSGPMQQGAENVDRAALEAFAADQRAVEQLGHTAVFKPAA
jgi:hypothetical protein